MRAHLMAALAEPAEDGVPVARKIVDALIARAREGDLASIRDVFERADGKPPPAPAAPDGGERKVTFTWLPNQPAATAPADPGPSA
jgi:hypothetical protein